MLLNSEVLYEKILESLYKMRVRESDQPQTVLDMYEQEINQGQVKAELSEVEDHGNTKFSSQKRKN